MPNTMPITPEVFEPYYEELVGDPTRVDTFREDLASRVNLHPDADPYDRLRSSAALLMHGATRNVPDLDDEVKARIYRNEEFGMRLTTGVLRGIDAVYTERATAPQDIANVTQNTNVALLHLYSIAFGDAGDAFANEATYFHGRDPQKRIARTVAKVQFAIDSMRRRAVMNNRTFVVEEDEAEQLDIGPRFTRRRSPKGTSRKCPASEARVDTGTRHKPALWVVMEAVGSVAITEIFTRHFTIVGDGGELLSSRQ